MQPIEVPDPAPAPDELLLSVAACAVCRTDLQLVEGDLDARRLPITPGHQAVGRVIGIGADVQGWDEGDRAGVAWLAETDGQCRFCRSGRENLCETARFTGWDRDGGYATQMTVRAAYAYRIPETFGDLDAAPLLCGGVIGYRALKVSGIQPAGRLGLFGFGASALLTLKSRGTGDARSTSGPARPASGSTPSSSGRRASAATTIRPRRSMRR